MKFSNSATDFVLLLALGGFFAMFGLAGCVHTPIQPVDYTTALGREAAWPFIRENLDSVRRCYVQRLYDDGRFQCRLTYSIQIEASGEPSAVEVVSAEGCLATDPVASCIRAKVLKWNFPPPRSGGPETFVYPFTLRSRRAKTTP